ncbi:hypothetical protein ATY48_19485 [Xanthomonas oryzae pv. oryzae]|nr:hypothetical protein AZ54_04105 [Xanthomonas oryzae pv. oryzae PXO86]ALZ70765.1 hypothetical protein APZ20_03785 [Xanthomonas oryzae pv. oryzae]AOS03885.1 hypothetical protein ATY42_19320 [Xanthomonas oryzae pv. oryzae]AOS07233.1 hypothetical protein ATY43_15620 [Xanthomonas oryzae pv. oryzae]AOS09587.1 hypothetical protein ATY44_03810 [Xanthomonas oryzae pv. oryzae]
MAAAWAPEANCRGGATYGVDVACSALERATVALSGSLDANGAVDNDVHDGSINSALGRRAADARCPPTNLDCPSGSIAANAASARLMCWCLIG